MDFLTAGISMIAVQLCMAMTMLGIWLADRRQAPGAQYWVMAEVLMSAGIAGVLLDHGAGQVALLILANTCIIWGVVFQYWGLQTFFGLPKGKIGAVLGVGYLLIQGTFLSLGTAVSTRVVLFSLTMLILVSLTLRLNLRQSHLATMGSRMVNVALILVMGNNLLRVVAAILTGDRMQVASRSTLNVVLLYMVPLICVVLYSVGLLLLYFERSLREQRHLASHDGLTGVLNRRAVVEAGADIMARSVLQHEPLSVALVDIDFFKRFNDELGHHAGDQVLMEVANLLTAHCRRHDLLGRYGGEEFLLVLPGVPAADCAMLGARLTGAVRQYRHEGRHGVTISAGFASLNPGDSWNSLLSRADTQLYRAKALGRDQYCVEGAHEQPAVSPLVPVPSLSPNHVGSAKVVQLKKGDKV
jgi:diguanylate cyclase (GGDEF)-like protein